MGFEEDYFWTGGGFSDWSGNSMGKFSWNSRGSSSSFGGASHSSQPNGEKSDKERIKEWKEKLEAQLAEERKHGLPKEAKAMPEFITLDNWLLRMGLILLSVLMQVVAMLMYICYPNQNVSLLPTLIFLLSAVGMGFLSLLSADWYVVKKHVTLGVIKTTMAAQKIIVLTACLTSVLIAFTPLWCYLFSQFIHEHKGLFVFLSIYETDDLSYQLFSDASGWTIGISTIIATYYLLCLAIGIGISYGRSRGKASERLTYTNYCQENGKATPKKMWSAGFLYVVLGFAFFLSCMFVPIMWKTKQELEHATENRIKQQQHWNRSHESVSSDTRYNYQMDDKQNEDIAEPAEISETTKQAPKPATSPTRYQSISGRSYGSSYSHSSSSHTSSYDDDWDDEDDDDTWYHDEDDADEKYEYDYWE